jgi:hypothetical protein
MIVQNVNGGQPSLNNKWRTMEMSGTTDKIKGRVKEPVVW